LIDAYGELDLRYFLILLIVALILRASYRGPEPE
jgi:hypothetical protein